MRGRNLKCVVGDLKYVVVTLNAWSAVSFWLSVVAPMPGSILILTSTASVNTVVNGESVSS